MVQAGRAIDRTAQVVRHDPAKFEEFASRYRAELEQPNEPPRLHLRDLAENGPLTLLTATKQPDISEAAVLADLLRH